MVCVVMTFFMRLFRHGAGWLWRVGVVVVLLLFLGGCGCVVVFVLVVVRRGAGSKLGCTHGGSFCAMV